MTRITLDNSDITTLRLHSLTAYYVRYVKLNLMFIRQDSLCDALPLFGVDIL